MRRPGRALVGGLNYRVKWVEEMGDIPSGPGEKFVGRCAPDDATIWVMRSKSEVVTLAHELIHAMFTAISRDALSHDEELVDQLANALVATLQQSPGLLGYLIETRKGVPE